MARGRLIWSDHRNRNLSPGTVSYPLRRRPRSCRSPNFRFSPGNTSTTMPPRGAACLRTARPASASTVRTLHISATLHKELPSNIFYASRNTNHSPFSPRAQTAPSATATPAATPSKFNLLNHSIKRAAPRTFDSAYRFSSIKPSPNLNWGINVQQNRATEFRIVNPVVVDKNDAVDEEELGKLIEENSRQYSSPAKHRSFGMALSLSLCPGGWRPLSRPESHLYWIHRCSHESFFQTCSLF